MVEADIAPGSFGCGYRFSEGLDPVDAEMIDQIAEEIVRIDLASIERPENQPVTGGEFGRQRDMKRLMDDRAAAGLNGIVGAMQDEREIDELIRVFWGHANPLQLGEVHHRERTFGGKRTLLQRSSNARVRSVA